MNLLSFASHISLPHQEMTTRDPARDLVGSPTTAVLHLGSIFIFSSLKGSGALLKTLFESPNFRVTVVGDSDTVEMCGALKNIVAVGAGFIDGMKCGDNTKSAVIRIGLMEMKI